MPVSRLHPEEHKDQPLPLETVEVLISPTLSNLLAADKHRRLKEFKVTFHYPCAKIALVMYAVWLQVMPKTGGRCVCAVVPPLHYVMNVWCAWSM